MNENTNFTLPKEHRNGVSGRRTHVNKYTGRQASPRVYLYACLLVYLLVLSCNLLSPTPASSGPDLFATLQASTPSENFTPGVLPSPAPGEPTPSFNTLPTNPAPTNSGDTTSIPFPTSADGLTGHIVFTCQIFKIQASNQVCIMNADGSGWKRLTTDNTRQHYYASLSPDGSSVVYAAFREANVYEIYEMRLADGNVRQLTNREGVLNAPEISPDGSTIVFMRWTVTSNRYQIWLMNRDGSEIVNVPKLTGWDPTWSPDGKQILFASDENGSVQLFTVNPDGRNQHQVSDLPAIRGRSDWSPNGQLIVTYSGEPWKREVYVMNADGSNTHQISPTGGNSQGAAFSPDGQWVAFTAYFDHYGDDHGCEIYVMRIDGSDLRRLTDNDYCDYQPRWGP